MGTYCGYLYGGYGAILDMPNRRPRIAIVPVPLTLAHGCALCNFCPQFFAPLARQDRQPCRRYK